MKKALFISAIALLAFVSCNKDNGSKPGDPVNAVFTATLKALEYSAESKAVIKPDLVQEWTSGDEIAVFDESTINKFTVVSATGSRADIKGQIGYGAEFCYAVYPFSAVTGFEDHFASITIPTTQESASPVVGVGRIDAQNNVTMRNILTYLEVKIPEGVTKITVSGRNNEKIAGTCKVNAITGVVVTEGSETSIVYTPAAGDTVCYVAMLPAELTQGVKIAYESNVQSRTALTEGLFLERDRVAKSDSVITEVALSFRIKDAAGLKEWANSSATWTSEDKVFIENDIDMDGVTWEPVDFPGTLDGQGHKIYNLVMKVDALTAANYGFFGKVTGPISNIIFGSKDGTNYDGKSKITINGNGGWKYGGLFAQVTANLTNVTTFVPVELAKGNTLKIVCGTLAGAVGVAGSTYTVSNCVSYANLTFDDPSSANTNEAILGGLLARCVGDATGYVTVKNCKYYGTAISTYHYTTTLGGIVGNAASKNIFKAEGCENFGTLAINSTELGNEGYCGGILGYANCNAAVGTEIKGCTNHVAITCTGITLGNLGGIAGRLTTGEITDCTNEGDITYDNENAEPNKNLLIGGIAGASYKGTNITGCTNKGKISANKDLIVTLGGIAGSVNVDAAPANVTVKNCTNQGACTVNRTKAGTGVIAVGGIVGYQTKTTKPLTIQGCTNSAKVTLSAVNSTTDAKGLTAGGIIGMAETATILTGNTNSADVAATVTGTPKSVYAGGVAGYLKATSSTGDKSNCKITLSAETATAKAAGAAAGYNNATVDAPVLGGSVNGTTLTAGNVASMAVGAGNAATNVSLAK